MNFKGLSLKQVKQFFAGESPTLTPIASRMKAAF